MTQRFTGWHMAGILVAFFAVIIAVNMTMARYAVSTFGGVTVENSYVASQHFNRWLDEAAVEQSLGWSAQVERLEDGRIALALAGPASGADVTAIARHPLGTQPDQLLHFAQEGGRYLSREKLPVDRWTLRLSISDQGRRWRTEVPLS